MAFRRVARRQGRRSFSRGRRSFSRGRRSVGRRRGSAGRRRRTFKFNPIGHRM